MIHDLVVRELGQDLLSNAVFYAPYCFLTRAIFNWFKGSPGFGIYLKLEGFEFEVMISLNFSEEFAYRNASILCIFTHLYECILRLHIEVA